MITEQSAVIAKYVENHNLVALQNNFALDFPMLTRETFNEARSKCQGNEISYHLGFARGYELAMKLVSKDMKEKMGR